MIQKPALSVVWSASAEHAASQPKEPPRRLAVPASQVPPPPHTFNYNWEERLEDVNPTTHPLMRFDEYRAYEDRLYDAVKILNAAPSPSQNEPVPVETSHASNCVLAAFWRLREARHNQNAMNRYEYRGCDDFTMAGEDMRALLKLTLALKPNSLVRGRIMTEWEHGVLGRDNANEGWKLRKEMQRGFELSIPGSDEAAAYHGLRQTLALKDHRAALYEQTGLRLVK